MESAARNSEIAALAPVSDLRIVSGGQDGGGLVSAVTALRELEDDILGLLQESDRILYALSSARVYEDAGFGTFEELEGRLLDPSSMLRAMRMAVARAPYESRRQPGGRRRRAAGDAPDSRKARGAGSERARRIQGLAAVSQSLTSLRSLDERLHVLADSARAALDDIEAQHLYDDCGYRSIEDFIERALSPSPVLAAVQALLAEEPAAASDELGLAGEPSSGILRAAPESSEELVNLADVSLLEEGAAPGNDFLSAPEADPGARASRAPAVDAVEAAAPRRGPMILSIVLAVVAAFAGSAAGLLLH
jgi:hypothetical protein